MKKKLLSVFSYCVVLALLLSLRVGFTVLSAATGDKTDVLISVGKDKEYRYAIDIL